MLAEVIVNLHNNNQFVIERNIEDITHGESLIQPEPEGNAMNWIIGHIIVGRDISLRLLGSEPLWDEEKAALYRSGSVAISEQSAVPITKLILDLQESLRALQIAVDACDDEQLIEMREEKTLAQELIGLAWHESYHAGQTDYLRRLAGKHEGGIR